MSFVQRKISVDFVLQNGNFQGSATTGGSGSSLGNTAVAGAAPAATDLRISAKISNAGGAIGSTLVSRLVLQACSFANLELTRSPRAGLAVVAP